VDTAVDSIIPPTARIEKLAEGFKLTEGPVWHHEGYLLFSDLKSNQIYQWKPNGQVSAWQASRGYAGEDRSDLSSFRSNGLTLDREGRVAICGMGNRRVLRLEKTGFLTVLAARYEGKRLNSPNDLVYRSDGTLYFTDPPFGLRESFHDPERELPYSGVFLLQNGRPRLISTDLNGPNGLAFSPDEKYLYVTNSDVKKAVVMRYEVNADGTLSKGRVFFDLTDGKRNDVDGMKVDRQGNLYTTGPGGIWIISSQGKHLGTIKAPELPANIAWGDDDGKTLYMTAETGLYRIRLSTPGVRP
jgi:gluconolactonase